jgi:hypothetical protein
MVSFQKVGKLITFKNIILSIIFLLLVILVMKLNNNKNNKNNNIEPFKIFFPKKTTEEVFPNGSPIDTHTIFCFWTGDNLMSENRTDCIKNLEQLSECNVVLVKKDDIEKYIIKDHPLHPAFKYLSETHKADYLRTYFMHFHGGGYSDIKKTTGSWSSAFEKLKNSDKFINGYREVKGGVAYAPFADKWNKMVGNCAYICKPMTPFTTEWYNNMIKLLDTKLDKLKVKPSTSPQDSAEKGTGYPIEWNEMLGRIFHRIMDNYYDKLSFDVPMPVFANYR